MPPAVSPFSRLSFAPLVFRWMRSQRDEHVLQVKPTRTSVNRMNASKTVAFEAFTRESVRTCSSITIAPDDDAGSHVFSL